MNIGTKTLLFGCHQFLVHPFFVWCAWLKVYHKLPNPKEAICIFIHDWGYWGKIDIDGSEGEYHPRWAARWTARHLGQGWGYFCMYHSKTLANRDRVQESRLCFPDKYGVTMAPIWWMVLAGKLSGETAEYRFAPKYARMHRERFTDYQLYADIRNYYRKKVAPEYLKGVQDAAQRS